MIKKVLIFVLPVLGFVGGAIGGDLLHAPKTDEKSVSAEDHAATSDSEASSHDAASGHDAEAGSEEHATADGHGEAASDAGGGETDWFKFPNQFFVPIIRNGSPTAIMVLTLSIEMPASARPKIEAQEARLRDALLSALMIEANTGGFDGNYTAETSLQRLRNSLLAAGQRAGGTDVQRILIEDIGRQEQ
ncbi:flagellar basal body-associated FliL family protein [Paracoccus lutimaris]|uniref:Flagellar protein FliL n=1 Tax=Paracoccus lutimaris TaxID=1490030 RepID=A0A368YPC4_9RHOB|nr:flagellar basal body-associated FliL family protein [Paracoccus lutimaris]RCW82055.1 hypothetical protein DFP89_11314 [Paracoccus lutimaris]